MKFRIHEHQGVVLVIYGPENLAEAQRQGVQVAFALHADWDRKLFERFLNDPLSIAGVSGVQSYAATGSASVETR